ncbi:hypothetical protein [Methylobacterium oryzisoli]|uniref:hypothetical protein n=1 Tax=Methylobacterium oryzisoli TaxID=3385502 RepID=UPI003891E9C0
MHHADVAENDPDFDTMRARRSLAEFPREAIEHLRLAIRRRLVARGVPEIEMEARIGDQSRWAVGRA